MNASKGTDTVNKADIIVGVQWGDEGKGRVVDHAAENYDMIARFGGGDNAGHTLVVGDRKLALRIVPSGVLREKIELFIGGGTVVSLEGLQQELTMLAGIGVDTKRIKVSDRAHVVFAYHAALDRARETARGTSAIGTTGRGIGPAYTDRAARQGITFADLREPATLAAKLRVRLESERFPDNGVPTTDELIAKTTEQAASILPHVVDGVAYLHDALDAGKRVLLEGAQGTMLDVGYGTYPYVTSSHTIAGGACTGLGLGPTRIGRVIGIAKAYCTRVGAGPFPSELHDEIGAKLRERGDEFGTVTRRPRRCGWFDAVAIRYAVRLNGLSSMVITKLDVLSGLERIGVVNGYKVGGRDVGIDVIGQSEIEPVIEWHAGWNDDLTQVRRIADLPTTARRYLEALEKYAGVSIESASVGPERASLATA